MTASTPRWMLRAAASESPWRRAGISRLAKLLELAGSLEVDMDLMLLQRPSDGK